MKILIHVMLRMHNEFNQQSNVIERVLNNKTIFNYLFVSNIFNVL